MLVVTFLRHLHLLMLLCTSALSLSLLTFAELHLRQVDGAQPGVAAGEYDSQKTLSDLFDNGDLAAGLQAWLRLTNNSITGIEDNVCIADEEDNTTL